MRVLIAEDDYTSRKILTAALSKWGHEPVVTEDGVSAWEALQQPGAPQLVLLDWDMPGMDGLDVCRRLRQDDSSSPAYVILLTGRGEKGDIVQGLEAGANDYLPKPYDQQELQARIGVGQRMLELQAKLLDAMEALQHLAMHDSLTGVLNRRAILDRLKEEISRSRRTGAPLSVAMCDLDHFKQVNDTLGHQAGDEVLMTFARCAQSHLREYDSVGRYGGEEFLVIASGLSGHGDGGAYERLREEIAGTTICTKAGPAFITVSIGVAQGSGQSSVDSLLAAADAALYQAKARGRNCVIHADE